MVPLVLIGLLVRTAEAAAVTRPWWLLAAGLVGAVAGWLVRYRERRGDPVLESRPAGACGGLLIVFAALGALDLLEASAPVYPVVLAAAALVILVFDREVRRPALFVALVQLGRRTAEALAEGRIGPRPEEGFFLRPRAMWRSTARALFGLDLPRDEVEAVATIGFRVERGMVGMAHAGKDSGGSQFFVTHSAQPHLDGRYTIFGRVVEGMDVVDAIRVEDRIETVKVSKKLW